MVPEREWDGSSRKASARRSTFARERSLEKIASSDPLNGIRAERETATNRCDGVGAMSIYVKINVINYNRTIVFPPETYVVIPVVPPIPYKMSTMMKRSSLATKK